MPLLIGRSANLRCFKSCHMTSLRVTYESNNKAWITGELIAAWMRRVDNRMRRQNRHILLFLDNCGAHPHMELENVKVIFLPPNTTSKLQPMDAGIIQNLKMVYQKKLLRHIIFLMDAASTASDSAKKVTVLDAILWQTSAWGSVKPETISKCFQKCGFSEALLDAAMMSGTMRICFLFYHLASPSRTMSPVTAKLLRRQPSVMTGRVSLSPVPELSRMAAVGMTPLARARRMRARTAR